MNYLRGSISAAYQYYKELPPINPSTLTGAIDVIVIQRKDESGDIELACTPFHVRFGKWQVLRPSDKKVNVLVNGRAIPFNMKIGEAGEAFFVFETEEDVPEDLITSPILQPTNPIEPSGTAQKTGRFGAKEPSIGGNDADTKEIVSGMEEQTEKQAKDDPVPEPDFFDLDAPSTEQSEQRDIPPLTELPPSTYSFPSSQPSTSLSHPNDMTASASHIKVPLTNAKNLAESTARLAREEEKERIGLLHDKLTATQNVLANNLRLSPDNSKPQPGDEALPKHKKSGSPPPVAYLHDAVIDMAGYHSKEASDQTITRSERRHRFEDDISASAATRAQKQLLAKKGQGFDSGTEDHTPTSSRAQSPDPTTPGTSMPISARATSEPPDLKLAPENSPPEYSWQWGGFPVQTPSKSSTFPGNVQDHPRVTGFPSSSEPTLPHTEAIPEVVEDDDINFGRGGLLKSGDQGDYILELKGETTEFDISLCGDLSDKDAEAERLFAQHRVPFQIFINDPAIVHKDELAVNWKGKFLSRKQSSPILAALIIWREATLGSILVQSDEEPLSSSDEREGKREPIKAAPPVTQGRWSRWFGRSRSNRETPISVTPPDGPTSRPAIQSTVSAPKTVESTPARAASPELSGTTGTEQPVSGPAATPGKHYVKTLRLTSDQLKALNLKKGPNSITFSLSTTGVVTCTARIFVWDATDQIVISDIDGTITKSDALGHVFTMIGRDWTHMGVAKLYTDICRNGYKIMYLTSRAIGQADSTRDYLRGINQNNYQLPEGPVIMSPDRLMASLHREVIMRQPEVFKMACLRDIQRLFGTVNRNPFYAGFGNRITDALSYRSVNVPSGRIFTIDSTGEVKMELLELAGYKSSYIHMTDLVDQMFPPIHRKWAPEFTDVNFWRDPMPKYDFPEFAPPSPPSPALSARSDASMQSGLSRLRNFSLRPQAQQFVPPSTSTHVHSRTQSLRSRDGGVNDITNNLGHARHTSAGGRFGDGIAIPRAKRENRSQDAEDRKAMNRLSGSMPGSYEEFRLDDDDEEEEEEEDDDYDEEYDDEGGEEEYDDEEEYDEHGVHGVHAEHDFNDELLATVEMDHIPFL